NMENLNKVRVKELRSDNGTEFRNHKLKEFYVGKRNFSKLLIPLNNDYFPYVPAYDPLSTNNISITDLITPSNPITSTDPITSSEPIILSSESLEFTTADDHHVLNEHDDSKLAEDLDIA
ncbi:hypothetical protein Tco_1130034, partial [Tanacetum coccineum]